MKFLLVTIFGLLAIVQCYAASVDGSLEAAQTLEDVNFNAVADEDTNSVRQPRQFCCGGGFGGFPGRFGGYGGFPGRFGGGYGGFPGRFGGGYGGFPGRFGGGYGGFPRFGGFGSSSASASASSSGGFFG